MKGKRERKRGGEREEERGRERKEGKREGKSLKDGAEKYRNDQGLLDPTRDAGWSERKHTRVKLHTHHTDSFQLTWDYRTHCTLMQTGMGEKRGQYLCRYAGKQTH